MNPSSHQTASYSSKKLSSLDYQPQESNHDSYSSIGNSSDYHSQASRRSDNSSVQQLKNALGYNHTIEASVAEFVLEMCSNDVGAAVAFYKAQTEEEGVVTQQNNESQRRNSRSSRISRSSAHSTSSAPAPSRQSSFRRPHPTHRTNSRQPAFARASTSEPIRTRDPLARQEAPLRRFASFDDRYEPPRHQPRRQMGRRRIKILDVAEAPSVTTPSPYRSNHSRFATLRSTKRAAPSRGLGRAKSERQWSSTPIGRGPVRSNSIGSTKKEPVGHKLAPTANFRRSLKSPRNRLEDCFHSSWKDFDCETSVPAVTITRPPTATRQTSSRSLGRKLSLRELQKCDPSAQAA